MGCRLLRLHMGSRDLPRVSPTVIDDWDGKKSLLQMDRRLG